jgi:hypothetical protein
MTKVKLPVALPEGILAKDLERPSFKSKDGLVSNWDSNHFELWCVAMRAGPIEWFIPTLLIAKASRRSANTTARTYATRVKDGASGYRIGRGPHVKAVVTVYIRKSRAKALQRFLDMRTAGQETAGQIRDRISSRRAQGELMRAQGRRSWEWDAS